MLPDLTYLFTYLLSYPFTYLSTYPRILELTLPMVQYKTFRCLLKINPGKAVRRFFTCLKRSQALYNDTHTHTHRRCINSMFQQFVICARCSESRRKREQCPFPFESVGG